MKKLLLISTILICSTVFAQYFYVSPSGSDSADGTKNAPFATLERAKQAVRRFKADKGWPSGGVNVWLREGNYYIEKSVVFDFYDSGTADAPVVYGAYPGESVSIRGGVDIAPKHFKPVTDAAIRERIVEKDAVDKIVQVDLKSIGITNFGSMNARGFRRPYINPGLELFFNNEPMTIARWPDDGFVPIGRVLDKGSMPREEDYENRGGKFMYNYDRANHWSNADDIYVSGNWASPFADDTIKVAKIDAGAKTIELAYAHMYGIKSGPVYCNYFVVNLLEEISRPGEWYLDRGTGIMYLYPPSDINQAKISISLTDQPLLVLEGASHVHFENLTIELTRGIGVYIERGEGNLVAGCTLRNIGTVAIVMGMGIKPDTINRHQFTGEPVSRELGSWHEHIYENATYNRQAGRNHGVLSCEIYNIGAGGVSMGGGDRLTLEKGGNYVKNCRIHNYNRLDRSYKAAVNVDGVGNLIAYNEIFDAPDMAVYLHGNDHIVEYNHIHHVMLESGEGGWFYMGRDAAEFGNIIRYNFVHHVGVLDDGSEGDRTEGSTGIYLDDFACGTMVYQNIFYKVGKERAAVIINGGFDNYVENNIFIDCRYALYASSLFKGWAKPMLVNFEPGGLYRTRLEAVNHRMPPYSEKYPTLVDILESDVTQPSRNFMRNNVYVDCGKVYRWNLEPNITLEGNYETTEDPGFVDFENLNFQLRSDSVVYEQIPEFKRIPLDKIGTYIDKYRKKIEKGEFRSKQTAALHITSAEVDVAKLIRVVDEQTIEIVIDVPQKYSTGQMSDIAIISGYTFEIGWVGGELSRFIVKSEKDGQLTVKYHNIKTVIKTQKGQRYGLDKELKDIWF